MKKIMFVAATLGGGGAERVMLNLANKMYEKGHSVVVIKTAIEKNPKAIYGLNPNIEVKKIQSEYQNKIARIVDKLRKLRCIFKQYPGYTIVSFLPDINIYSIFASKGLKNKIVVSERNDPNKEPNNSFVRHLRNFSYHMADYVVFQTFDAQAYFAKKIREKSCIIPNPLNLEELPLPNAGREKRNVIIMVCRVKPQKNIEMMIEAISKFRNAIGDTTVEIYGDGNLYRDRMKEKVSSYGLEDIIKFMDSTNDIYSVMEKSKIYVSTSDYEGISNTMLEALAIGVPSIVTDCPIGGARMFIKHNYNGILVPVNDYERLGNEIIRLLNDESLQRQFSANSIAVRNELDLNIIADKWLKVL